MVVDEMLMTILQLKKDGLDTINLYNSWHGRRLVPLASRSHWIYEYTGRDDGTKACTVEWKANEYSSVLKNITDA